MGRFGSGIEARKEQLIKTLYTAVSTAHGGRDGHVRSSDGIIDLDVKTAKERAAPVAWGPNEW